MNRLLCTILLAGLLTPGSAKPPKESDYPVTFVVISAVVGSNGPHDFSMRIEDDRNRYMVTDRTCFLHCAVFPPATTLRGRFTWNGIDLVYNDEGSGKRKVGHYQIIDTELLR